MVRKNSIPDVEGFSVQEDGVKIGWKVFGFLAALGVGLYVTSIVNPIEERIDEMRVAMSGLEVRVSEVSGRLHASEQDLSEARSTIRVLQNEVDHLRRDNAKGG